MHDKSVNHIVQFYGDNDRSLVANISRYLADGLKQDDGILVIASPERVDAVERLLSLHASCHEAVRAGRAACLDARMTLDRLFVDGQPRWDRFERVVGGALRPIQERTGHPRVRVYTEMVDLLWQAGQSAATIDLEHHWNTFLAASSDCQLFCSYAIDIFIPDFEPAVVAPILCAHARLLPVGEALEFAVDWAVDELLGARLGAFDWPDAQPEWAAVPRTVATILWLKERFPEDAKRVLRLARHYYEL